MIAYKTSKNLRRSQINWGPYNSEEILILQSCILYHKGTQLHDVAILQDKKNYEMWFLGDYGDEKGDFSGGWNWSVGENGKCDDVDDNPQNKWDMVFMCGMILFRVDAGIGKDHATVFLHLTA